MANDTLEPAAGAEAGPRRFKPEARRRIAVLLGGVFLGGAAAFSLEVVGAPPQVASTIGGALTTLVAALEELRDRRAEPRAERLERLVRGDVYRHPLLMVFYTVLALFLVSNLVAVPLARAVWAFFYIAPATDFDLYETSLWDPYVAQALLLTSVPLTFFYTLPIAKAAAHRLRHHAFLWVTAALVATTLLGLIIVEIWDAASVGLSRRDNLLYGAAGLLAGLPAVALGTRWARRTQSAFVMKKLFRQLSPTDKNDVIDLVRTLPRDRSA